MIRVEQLTKNYAAVTAVDNISFEVSQHEILGFLGPNGAGKTTTLRILTGYLSASSGRVTVGGHDVFLKPEQGRLEFMTVMEEYLDHYIASQCIDTQQNITQAFNTFGNQIAQTMGQAVNNIQHSTQALENSINVFDRALNTFGNNIGDFSEFNINLRNNISRMDVNFIKLTEALQELTEAERQGKR